MNYQTLNISAQGFILEVRLSRPQVRNAMSLEMVNELTDLFRSLSRQTEVRALVLRGAEGHFCAGGDIKDMANARARAGDDSVNPYYRLNRAFGEMITLADRLPLVVITVLEGAVLGGGLGLACVSDVAITLESAQFGLPETGLGVIPAQIAPFVVTRVGLTQARRLALLGERFDGAEAVRLGIAHYLCASAEELEERLQQVLTQVKRVAPGATATTKRLLHQVGEMDMEPLLDKAAEQFAAAVIGEEGSEGTLAFVGKRLPAWAQ
ncbi:MAG: enoyl-CoA hydratase-related protein [Pseudomonadota bacterium]|nr:enoyl-CoA hydratase-related protein [Pseudomonadota bacterium]